jgi:hypothetical protein
MGRAMNKKVTETDDRLKKLNYKIEGFDKEWEEIKQKWNEICPDPDKTLTAENVDAFKREVLDRLERLHEKEHPVWKEKCEILDNKEQKYGANNE